MTLLNVVVTAGWIVVAALQLVAARASLARPGVTLGFGAAGVLVVVGAVSNRLGPLLAGSALAVTTPLWVGLTRPEGPRWSHHLLRAGILLGLLMLSTWA
ncbi:MAG: hypothetical protein KDB63_22650 [Nocardioidaceae bacterium]|nr:hypothetical protein [Nocardioidaceae bacterium]